MILKFWYTNIAFILEYTFKSLRICLNILLEGSMSQNLDLGPGFIFMKRNIQNSEKIH